MKKVLFILFVLIGYAQTELKQGSGSGTGLYFNNGLFQAGNGATQGGIFIAQKYSEDDYLGTISSHYSSGNLILGYGAAGMSGQGSAGQLVSTFDNFTAHRGAIRIGAGTFEFLNTTSAVQAPVNSELSILSRLFVAENGNVGIGTDNPGVFKLNVNGTIKAGNAHFTGTYPIIVDRGTASGGFLWQDYHVNGARQWRVRSDISSYQMDFESSQGIQTLSLKQNGDVNVFGSLSSTNSTGLYVNSSSYARIRVDGTNNQWKYLRLEREGTVLWDIAVKENDLSGALQWRPSGSPIKRMYLTNTGNLNVSGAFTSGASLYASGTLNSTSSTGLYVNSSSSARIRIDGVNDQWKYIRLEREGTPLWDIAVREGSLDGALQWRPAGGDNNRMYLTKSGKLVVTGSLGIEAQKIKVTSSPGADFVFEDDYNLKSLSETESFIKENKHLPEIPSAKDMKENGLDMSEFQIKLLQKIEELTLHTIRQQKEIDELKEKSDNK